MASTATEQGLTRTPIKSFHGLSSCYCKDCGEFALVAFHVTGTGASPFTGERIQWDYITDSKGHCLRDYSH